MHADPGNLLTSLLPEALGFLERLVRVNSFTGNPAGVDANADLVARQFSSLGFSAEHVPDPHPAFGRHLFLRRDGPGPEVLLVTHLDTVFPPEEERLNDFGWRPEGDRIFGPGVIDNKGGTAMIWLVLSALRLADPEVFDRTRWIIAADAAEEDLTSDFPRLCRERISSACRAALVFESCAGQSDGYSVVRSRKGSVNLLLEAEGRGAHAGSRFTEGANAVVALSRAITKISDLTDLSRGLTVNVGRVTGGGPSNRVPHAAACEINVRASEEAVLEDTIAAVQAITRADPEVRAVSDGHPCRLRATLTSRNPAWPANPETETLIRHWLEAADAHGIPLAAEARGGLSDGNYLSRFLPVLDGLGPFGRNGHASQRSPDGTKEPECVLPDSFARMGGVNVAGLRRILR